jgi:hypothetical protein
VSKGKEIFQAVCDAPDVRAALKELPPKHWVTLYSFLLQGYEENSKNGITGHVLGMMLLEGAQRYAEAWTKNAKLKSIL